MKTALRKAKHIFGEIIRTLAMCIIAIVSAVAALLAIIVTAIIVAPVITVVKVRTTDAEISDAYIEAIESVCSLLINN